MTIKRIKDFPDGSGSLSNDDIMLFMDDPNAGGTTKKISVSQLSSIIGGGGGGGNPFDQDLNTTNFPTFSGVSLSNGTTLTEGTYDNGTGGNGGISINCYVGYELNWQGGHLKSTYNNGQNTYPIYIDSAIVLSSGITFSDSTIQTSAGITSDITGITGASGINNIVSISQANYDNIITKDPNTLYLIVG